VLGRHVARDRERHRQRQRDHTDHQCCEQVGAKILDRVALAEPSAQPVGEKILGAVGQRELLLERLRQLVDVAQ